MEVLPVPTMLQQPRPPREPRRGGLLLVQHLPCLLDFLLESGFLVPVREVPPLTLWSGQISDLIFNYPTFVPSALVRPLDLRMERDHLLEDREAMVLERHLVRSCSRDIGGLTLGFGEAWEAKSQVICQELAMASAQQVYGVVAGYGMSLSSIHRAGITRRHGR